MFYKLCVPKAMFVYGLILALAALSIALYLQFFQGLEPCSLCIFQRLAYFAYSLIALIAIIQNPKGWGARVYAFLQILISFVGLSIALRQVWLQSLPAGQVPICGPGINYLLQEFSLQKVVAVVWAGDSDCAIVTWRFWTLSMASWSAIVFAILFLFSIFMLLKRYRPARKKEVYPVE